MGPRSLPTGIDYYEGSDWHTLSRDFIEYLLFEQNDPILSGLFTVYNHTLLSAERFYLSALKHSKFCTKHFDWNFKLLGMDPNRKKGCHMHRPSADFNGCKPVNMTACSPYVFEMDRWSVIEDAMNQKGMFFARKFDSSIDILIQNKIDKILYNIDIPSKFWLNVWHNK